MRIIVCARSLALASLFAVSACVDEAGGGEADLRLGVAEAALSSPTCPPGTPAELAPGAEQDLAFALDAIGVQKYRCSNTAAGSPAWTFVAPDAKLFSACGHQVGTHYAGPTWALANGSTVVGAVDASVTVDATAIPWLLLSVVSHDGPPSQLTLTSAIQRVLTTGGRAPATGCDADHLGATADVSYTATYLFYRERPQALESNTRCGASS